MSACYRVRGWAKFQHYKDRKPPWIKLHRGLLDDIDYLRLHVASRALAPCVWLLASESATGEITMSPEDIAFRLRLDRKEVASGITGLISAGFLIDASTALAPRKQGATLEIEIETETEREGEGEKDTPLPPKGADRDALAVYGAYPKKVGKAKAITAIKKALAKTSHAELMEAVTAYATATSWQERRYIPHPSTWFNEERWSDDRATWIKPPPAKSRAELEQERVIELANAGPQREPEDEHDEFL